MRRTLCLFACAAGMLVVAVGAAALLKDKPSQEAMQSEVSGRIVGLTEYQQARGAAEGNSLVGEARLSPRGAAKSADILPLRMGNMPPSAEKSTVMEGRNVSQPANNAYSQGHTVSKGKGVVHEEGKHTSSGAEALSSSKNQEHTKEGNAPAARGENLSPQVLEAENTANAQARENLPSKAEASGEERKSSPAFFAAAADAADNPAPSSTEALAEANSASGGENATEKKPQNQYERVVTSAKFSMKGSLIKLVLQGNAPMVGHCSVLGNPNRVVLDLAGNWALEAPHVPSNRLVQAVRVGQHDDKTRIVLDMKTMGKVALVPVNRNSLELSIQ